LRVLAVTKIFPNAAEPLSAPFNRQQFAALARRCRLDVLATIPWFPGARMLGRWSTAGRLAAVPRREVIGGLDVRHPRTLFVPRTGHSLWGPLYAASLAPEVVRWRGQVDVVLGSWAYPDGFAAIVLARALGAPVVVKLHGSDLNLVGRLPGPRRMLRWLLPRANRVVAVSRALGEEAAALGVPAERIAVVMNGVDGALFEPRDRATARATLGLPAAGPLLLFVGHLKPVKGVADLIAAFEAAAARHPSVRLAIVGGGELQAVVDAARARLGDRLHLPGARPLAEVPTWMAACDALVLASHHEGTPNVILEALACGRRVVATAVGGIPDLITDPVLGDLVPPGAAAALAAAMVRAAEQPYDPAAVAARGARGGWDASAEALHAVLREAVAEGARGAR
jgi:teichuronic acid biosynthesis glycosyltransferase TuaC